MKLYLNSDTSRGFTIVELLIVIVVIAILAAITIVAYNGIQNRAKTTSAQSAAVNAEKKAEAYNAENNSYPLASTDLTGASPSTSYQLTGVTFGTPSASASPSTLIFRKCGSGSPATQAAITASNITGVRFVYFDYVNNNTNSYADAGNTTGTGVACPAS